jgi:hypothetical protein
MNCFRRLLPILAFGAVIVPSIALSQNGVTIDDLVRRAQIPLAAISPDGRLAAYLLLRGDPTENLYNVEVTISPVMGNGSSVTVARYQLQPDEAFDETEGFKPNGGELRWASDQTLIFLTKAEGKMQLVSWNSIARKLEPLATPHDQVVVTSASLTDDSLSVTFTDYMERPVSPGLPVPDNAWRMRDSYRFYGPFRNPTTGRWARSQKYLLTMKSGVRLVPTGEPTEDWAALPTDWAYRPTRSPTDSTMHRYSKIYNAVRSPDGAFTVAVEGALLDLNHPDSSYTSYRIILSQGEKNTVLVPFTRPGPKRTILGWAPDSLSIYYIDVGGQESSLNRVTVAGKITRLYSENAELELPGDSYDRRGDSLNRAATTALLVRSKNTLPGELITLELETGRVKIVSKPNAIFEQRPQPEVRFYPIDLPGQDVYGRLYLPLQYREGTRYPLVITQYYSRPGFYAATGEEVPIFPLTANGVAVFTVHSSLLDQTSHEGDFRLELSRVQKPLRAMEWISRTLVAQGIVDPERIGITGLSYGAEIAMYAYWESRLFRTASVSTPSWDQSLVLFGGLGYAARLEERGFPMSQDQAATRLWSELSAGANARATLPPLLVQSAEGEENYTVPTWFQLRRAGAPVEWYEYPNEGHVKRSPANKWWVYERNLDWFLFWLKDEEDPSAAKEDQYQRWQEMRTRWNAARKSADQTSVALRPNSQ